MNLYYDNSELAMKTKGEYKLSSPYALKILNKIKNNEFSNKISELKTIYSYFNLIDG
jgi:hypothetical protein